MTRRVVFDSGLPLCLPKLVLSSAIPDCIQYFALPQSGMAKLLDRIWLVIALKVLSPRKGVKKLRGARCYRFSNQGPPNANVQTYESFFHKFYHWNSSADVTTLVENTSNERKFCLNCHQNNTSCAAVTRRRLKLRLQFQSVKSQKIFIHCIISQSRKTYRGASDSFWLWKVVNFC